VAIGTGSVADGANGAGSENGGNVWRSYSPRLY
jgi:hypothetical protein